MPRKSTSRTRCSRALTAALLACACLALTTTARAGETLEVHANFSPDKLGVPTNLSATARLGSSTGGLPSPLRRLTVYAPAGATLDVRGAGVCAPTVLEQLGPQGCPADSRAGFGGGTALVELGQQVVPEEFTLDVFLAPRRHGSLSFLAYVRGSQPDSIELVLTAEEIRASKPYGFGVQLQVPPIATVPGAADASIESAFMTFGSTNVAYEKLIHGKRTLLHIRGLITPRTCPHGGFPIEGMFTLADGSTSVGRATIPCPRR